MADILFETQNYIFSYRVAGILVQNGKVLLQKPIDDTGFAFPGGHVAFGETNEQTLIREFKEEIGADVLVGELKWVAEIFFPWHDKPCHQICLYYVINILQDGNIPETDIFIGEGRIEERKPNIEFHWVPFDKVKNIKIYPTNAAELLDKLGEGVQHFIYRES